MSSRMASSQPARSLIVILKMNRHADKMLEFGFEELMPAKTIEVVDPEGDVIFSVGKGRSTRDMKVSGALLCRASPTLSTMVTATKSQVVIVKDGDPGLYLDFFNIIHYKPYMVGELKGKRLFQLAHLAVVNFCIEAIKPFIVERLVWVIHEFAIIAENPTGPRDIGGCLNEHRMGLEILLMIAYYCEIDHIIWGASKLAIAQAPGQIRNQFESELINDINTARKDHISAFLHDVFDCIARDSIPVMSNANIGQEELHACGDRYGAFAYLLMASGIEAHKIALYTGSLRDAIRVVQEITTQEDLSNRDTRLAKLDKQESQVAYLARDIKGDLLKLVDKHTSKLQGICFRCWKDGRSFWKPTFDHKIHNLDG